MKLSKNRYIDAALKLVLVSGIMHAFLLLILLAWHCYQNYRVTKDRPALLIFSSFSIIALSQILAVFLMMTKTFYVVSEIVQLLGYSLLLSAFLMVLYYGTKKNKN